MSRSYLVPQIEIALTDLASGNVLDVKFDFDNPRAAHTFQATFYRYRERLRQSLSPKDLEKTLVADMVTVRAEGSSLIFSTRKRLPAAMPKNISNLPLKLA